MVVVVVIKIITIIACAVDFTICKGFSLMGLCFIQYIMQSQVAWRPTPCPASSVRAREGAGCGSVGAVSGA